MFQRVRNVPSCAGPSLKVTYPSKIFVTPTTIFTLLLRFSLSRSVSRLEILWHQIHSALHSTIAVTYDQSIQKPFDTFQHPMGHFPSLKRPLRPERNQLLSFHHHKHTGHFPETVPKYPMLFECTEYDHPGMLMTSCIKLAHTRSACEQKDDRNRNTSESQPMHVSPGLLDTIDPSYRIYRSNMHKLRGYQLI